MPLLLLGGAGQVGTEFLALAQAAGLDVVAPASNELDLTDKAALANFIHAASWDVVINAAAYTDVDRAEGEECLAFRVNAEAPSQIAAETARRGIPLIHISTDYVFDGRKGTPYVETDATTPLNAYGRSKLAGEQGVASNNSCHIILRTSWVYSPFGRNFVKTILRLACERERLTVVADQLGCPTAARDVAQACHDIAIGCVSRPRHTAYGIYHFAGDGEATWFEFARSIVGLAEPRLGRAPSVAPIRTIDYPTPAVRAPDTRLDCSKIGSTFGIRARPWPKALAETIDRLLTQKAIT